MSNNLFKRIITMMCISYGLTAYPSDVSATLFCSCWDGSGSHKVSGTKCYGRAQIDPEDFTDIVGAMFTMGMNFANKCRQTCENINTKRLEGKQWVFPYIDITSYNSCEGGDIRYPNGVYD